MTIELRRLLSRMPMTDTVLDVARAKKPTKPRVRRDPEAARELILAAAEHLFANQSPDVVGLKDVARVAGVSHALVSHYFGTYDRLVDAVLERRAALTRAGVF